MRANLEIIEALATAFMIGGEKALERQYKLVSPADRVLCELTQETCPTCERVTVQIQGVCVMCHRKLSAGKTIFEYKELRVKKDDNPEVSTLVHLFESSVQDTIKSEADCMLQEFALIQKRYSVPARAIAMVIFLTRSAEKFSGGLKTALEGGD